MGRNEVHNYGNGGGAAHYTSETLDQPVIDPHSMSADVRAARGLYSVLMLSEACSLHNLTW